MQVMNETDQNPSQKEEGFFEKNWKAVLGGLIVLAICFWGLSSITSAFSKKDVDENNDLYASAGQDLNSAYKKQRTAEKSRERYLNAASKFCANQDNDDNLMNTGSANTTTKAATSSESNLTDDEIVAKAVDIAKKEKVIQDAKDKINGKCETASIQKPEERTKVVTRTKVIYLKSPAPCPTPAPRYSAPVQQTQSNQAPQPLPNNVNRGAQHPLAIRVPAFTDNSGQSWPEKMFPGTKQGRRDALQYAEDHGVTLSNVPDESVLPD